MEKDVNTLAEAMLAAQKISGQWPLNELGAIFDKLTTYDLGIEAKLARIKKLTTLAFVAFFVSIVLTIFIGNLKPNLLALPIVLAVITLIGGISGLVLKARYRQRDLRNEFRVYLRPLLEHLRDDLKKDSLVNIVLSLSPVAQKRFRQGKSKPYESGAYYKCYDEQFQQDFLTLKLRLSDGNRVLLTGAEILTKISKTKKNPRGKYKTKTVYKKRVRFDVRIIAASENFVCKPLPQEGAPKLYAKQIKGDNVLGVKFMEKFKGVPEEMMPDPLLTLRQLVTLYTFLEPKTAS